MGSQKESLVRTPFSEVMATLETLATFGVRPEDLRFLRDNPISASAVAQLIRTGAPPATCPPWEEKDNVITFSVTTNGLTGKNWIKAFDNAGTHVDDWAQTILLSPRFKPTIGVTLRVVIIKASRFLGELASFDDALAFGIKEGFLPPAIEIACLIRYFVPNEVIEQMRLSFIQVMHRPVESSKGVPGLLFVNNFLNENALKGGMYRRGALMGPRDGFAFVSPEQPRA